MDKRRNIVKMESSAQSTLPLACKILTQNPSSVSLHILRWFKTLCTVRKHFIPKYTNPAIFRRIQMHFAVSFTCFFSFRKKKLYSMTSLLYSPLRKWLHFVVPSLHPRFLCSAPHDHSPPLFIVRYFMSLCLYWRQNLARSGGPRLIWLSCLCMTSDW